VLTPLGFRLLRRLADGEVHSGEALATAVGMSRARVSQVLKEADSAGLRLERIRGRGYRLHDPVPFLDRDAIVAALGTRAKAVKLDVVDAIDSTSSELNRRAAREDVHRRLLIAEWQTAGRGRRGRGWTAIAGGSLTFSLGWRFEQGAGFLAGLSLAVVRNGKVIKAKGYGLANLEWNVPATADTAYQLASVSKQFTATAIMLLVEEGKLRLSDSVTKHFAELPAAWSNITVRHLLTMTSGIKDYLNVVPPAEWRNDFTHARLLEIMKNEPLDFAAGDNGLSLERDRDLAGSHCPDRLVEQEGRLRIGVESGRPRIHVVTDLGFHPERSG